MRQETQVQLGRRLFAAFAAALIIWAAPAATGRPFLLVFNPSAMDTNGLVSGYNVCISNTSNGARQFYAWVNHGVANCPFDTTNSALPNPVFFSVITVATNKALSPGSAAFLFDTNNYPVAAPPEPPPVIPLTPPTGLTVQPK